MKNKRENGYTLVDIAISVVVLFIFISILAMLFYQFGSSSDEIERKSTATNLAISEIEQIKSNGFEKYRGLNQNSTKDNDGNTLKSPIQTKEEGFSKTITVQDYKDLEGNSDAIEDVVKIITVKISYMFKGEEQTVELSTVLSKENS